MMSPHKVSAEFAAFTWFVNTSADKVSTAQALQFARKNWASFLPCAHAGLGRLLLRLAAPQRSAERKKTKRAGATGLRMARATAG
jgi:hypothetical protein